MQGKGAWKVLLYGERKWELLENHEVHKAFQLHPQLHQNFWEQGTRARKCLTWKLAKKVNFNNVTQIKTPSAKSLILPKDISEAFAEDCSAFYTSEKPSTGDIDSFIEGNHPKVLSEEQRNVLVDSFTAQEIKKAITDLKTW